VPVLARLPLSRLRPVAFALVALCALAASAGLGTSSAGATTPSPASAASSTSATPSTPAAAGGSAPSTTPQPPARTPAFGVVPDVATLTVQGTTTTVTVHRIYRSGQRDWVSHVLDTRLADLDGCQALRTPSRWTGSTYRSSVRTVCLDGSGRAEAAARSLVHDRPWYLVGVHPIRLVGFTMLADLPSGNGRAYPAAVAALPKGPLTLSNGDDVSVDYVGEGVTQAQLRAAVTAFAGALGIPTSKVSVGPILGG